MRTLIILIAVFLIGCAAPAPIEWTHQARQGDSINGFARPAAPPANHPRPPSAGTLDPIDGMPR
jgi:hypothetical protein